MDDILDEQHELLPPSPPWWPSVIMGGLAGAALILVFNKITSAGGPVVLIHLIVTFIVLNSTLTHYRSKPFANQSFPIAFAICFATYTLMMFTSKVIMMLWFGNEKIDFAISFDNAVNSVVMLVAGGVVISAVAAFLSKRYQPQ